MSNVESFYMIYDDPRRVRFDGTAVCKAVQRKGAGRRGDGWSGKDPERGAMLIYLSVSQPCWHDSQDSPIWPEWH